MIDRLKDSQILRLLQNIPPSKRTPDSFDLAKLQKCYYVTYYGLFCLCASSKGQGVGLMCSEDKF